MSEPTLEEMRTACWRYYRTYDGCTGNALIPSDAWPSTMNALILLREIGEGCLMQVSFWADRTVHIDFKGHLYGGDTLSEAAIRCAWGQLTKEGNK